MTPQKKQMTPGTNLKGRKGRLTSSKSGMRVRLSPNGKPSQTASFRRAVARSIATTKKNGNPVAKYDVQRRRAYLEYPDGTKAYVE